MLNVENKPGTKPSATAPGAAQPNESNATQAPSEETDGFQLVIDALKLNGIDTIYGLPGIPITDLTRRAQANGSYVVA